MSKLGQRGIRSLAVARKVDGEDWKLLGMLTFLDPPRPDTKDTIHRAMEFGVDVKMITGGFADVVLCAGGRGGCPKQQPSSLVPAHAA